MFRSSQPFESQFRWEVDRWVFRFRQRGTPVEVTAVERELLVARHIRRSKTGMRVWFAGVFASGFLVSFVLGLPGMKELAAACYFGSAVLLGFGLRYWADQAVTYHLTKRVPVGEKLGFFGGWMMRAEVTPWPQLLAACVILPPVFFMLAAMPDEFTGMQQWVALGITGLVTAALAFMVTIKLLLGWRERRRNAWRGELDEARDLRIE